MAVTISCVIAVVLLVVAPVGSLAQAKYTYQMIHASGAQQTLTNGINDMGKVIGWYADQGFVQHAFIFQAFQFTPVTIPGAIYVNPFGISHMGYVGVYSDASWQTLGFHVLKGQVRPVAVPGATYTLPFGVSNDGKVVGSYGLGEGEYSTETGFLLEAGVFSTIAPPGAQWARAYGVNVHGQVVGTYSDEDWEQHGFLYDHGVYTIIDVPGDVGGNDARGINDHGDIVGSWFPANGGMRGYLFDGTTFSTLNAYPGKPSSRTILMGVNNKRHVVGWLLYDSKQGYPVHHGFVALPKTPKPPKQAATR
jgi:probable HAF family extracellular repeat protein